MGRLQGIIRSEAYTVQPIDQFSKAPLHRVATFVPFPPAESVTVDVPFVDQDVLRELRRVVVQEVPERVDALCDRRSKECVLLW